MSFLYLVIELFLTLIVELWLISSFFTLSQLLIDICSSKLIQSSNELDVKKLIADIIFLRCITVVETSRTAYLFFMDMFSEIVTMSLYLPQQPPASLDLCFFSASMYIYVNCMNLLRLRQETFCCELRMFCSI